MSDPERALDQFRLDDRVVVVTGASSGLGQRFARVVSGVGAKVVLAARRVERLKALSADLPDALAVLREKKGDCKAHSVLLVALARAAGLPARPVSGLVETGDGRFYYHQWAEIYAGRWLPVDPVFNQVPADATHIKLNEGGLLNQIRLANIIGSLKIDVLDFQTDGKEITKPE